MYGWQLFLGQHSNNASKFLHQTVNRNFRTCDNFDLLVANMEQNASDVNHRNFQVFKYFISAFGLVIHSNQFEPTRPHNG